MQGLWWPATSVNSTASNRDTGLADGRHAHAQLRRQALPIHSKNSPLLESTVFVVRSTVCVSRSHAAAS
jgi:hypothetical protein